MGQFSSDAANPFHAHARIERRSEASCRSAGTYFGRELERLYGNADLAEERRGRWTRIRDQLISSLMEYNGVQQLKMAPMLLKTRAGDGDRTRDVQLGKMDVKIQP